MLTPANITVIKINDNTHHDGIHLEKMVEFYHDVDVQLCTSFREGTHNPLFEAAACGKALISTKVGCAPDLISDSFNGFLV
ncbi:MAG: glycosyltransferase, partial [Bacteroidetes bacterium]|nr:glycosyltransferase [Bacteroidota bacterium]